MEPKLDTVSYLSWFYVVPRRTTILVPIDSLIVTSLLRLRSRWPDRLLSRPGRLLLLPFPDCLPRFAHPVGCLTFDTLKLRAIPLTDQKGKIDWTDPGRKRWQHDGPTRTGAHTVEH